MIKIIKLVYTSNLNQNTNYIVLTYNFFNMKKEIVIEIPKGSKVKYELENGRLLVDRILFGSMGYPANYGFIENTLDWDGDPLDALVIADQEFLPGSIVPTRIIGAMKMIDGGETDTKLIAVIDVDPRYEHIKSLKDLGNHTLKEFQDFFENYKNLQNKTVEILGFEDEKYAEKEFNETVELFNKYKDMDKKEFVKLMMKEHPEKYK